MMTQKMIIIKIDYFMTKEHIILKIMWDILGHIFLIKQFLIFGVLVLSFLMGFYAIAWQEPTANPPGGNVYTPLNRGDVPQDKIASLTFPIFFDSDDLDYWVNPAGQTFLAGLGILTTATTQWTCTGQGVKTISSGGGGGDLPF